MYESPRSNRRTFLRAAGATAFAGVAVGDAGAAPDPDAEPASELLIGIDRSAPGEWPDAVERAVPQDARVRRENRTLGYVVVELPEGTTAGRATAAGVGGDDGTAGVAAADEVAYVEGNVRYRPLGAWTPPPDDPGYEYQYAIETIGASEAWATTTGSAGVTVAVIDQGVAYDHPDLADNVRADPGRDFVAEDGDPAPATTDGHGTEVAGIVGAVANNGEGIAGLSQSELIVGRALGETYGTLADIADAIQWAADEGADVINLSLGSRTDAETMQRALAYAEEAGALLVAAAGNEGGAVRYPAANEECIGVSALTPEGTVADFSNTGPGIELAAPGVDVLTTTLGNRYDRFTGTSAATPVISGVAALALSRWDLTGPELRYHLAATATDLGLAPDEQGYGRVNAAAAVNELPKTIAIVGTDGYASYEFSVSGTLRAGERANTEDAVSGTTATGAVQNGMDTYRFSGEVTGFGHDGPVSVAINGQPTDYGDSATSTSEGPAALPGFDAPTDPDGDGRYEDVTGDGTANIVDVQALFVERNGAGVTDNPDAFDFSGDGTVDIVDVQALFTEVT